MWKDVSVIHKKPWDLFPTSAVRQIINSVAWALSEAISCEAGCEMRLIPHFYFFILLKAWRRRTTRFGKSKASPIQILEKAQSSCKSLESFCWNLYAKRKKVTQKTKNEKTPSSKHSANNTNNTPTTNRCTCKHYTQNLSPFLFADSWHRTCLEVANFLRGQRVIYQQFQTNHNPNQLQIIITKSRVRHTRKKLLKYS